MCDSMKCREQMEPSSSVSKWFQYEDSHTRTLYADALYALPVENELFKQHTYWPGLFFRTWRMERVFLDGYARLHKNLVYIGFPLMWLALCANGFVLLGTMLCVGDTVRHAWVRIYNIFWKRYLFFLVGMLLVGCLLNWIIHKLDRIKEKSWAMLATWLVYLTIVIYIFLMGTILSDEDEVDLVIDYPIILFGMLLVIFPEFVFLSGTPSFMLYLVLCFVGMLIYGLAYPANQKYLDVRLKEGSGEEVLQLKNTFLQYVFYCVLFVVLSLCGAFLKEIASRKQFLQRMIIGNQQQQIIEQKSRNTALQKRLLNNMLPPVIVDQLQEQDFEIDSWDQLRGLSKRHFGVSILFAEVDGFASLSAQVDPPVVLAYLNDLFNAFELLCEEHSVYKVETVGDQYVAAVGVVTGVIHTEHVYDDCDCDALGGTDNILQKSPTSVDTLHKASISNTIQMLGFAKAIMARSLRIKSPLADVHTALRVGIHTGTCIGGIVGSKTFRFCLFGDAMNTAARMEQKGKPRCIHVTEDVVALVPDESWEQLALMDVKGKGCMQTYMLRVCARNDVGSDEYDTEDHTFSHVDLILSNREDNNIALFLSKEEDFYHTSLATMDTEDIQIWRVDAIETLNLNSGVYQDVMPISNTVFYKEHTVWFGLFFRKLETERAYLDGQARLDKPLVYWGYILYMLVLLSNLLYGYLYWDFAMSSCKNPDDVSWIEEWCKLQFGSEAYSTAQDIEQSKKISYEMLTLASRFKMLPVSAGILFGLVIIGWVLHWNIHRSGKVKEKWWATLSVWFFYILVLVIMMLFMTVFLGMDEVTAQFRPNSFLYVILYLSTLSVFFSGVPFVPYLLWWVLALGLYFGLGIPLAVEAIKTYQKDKTPLLLKQTNTYIISSVYIVSYAFVLCIGTYLRDIANRKTFLQRCLMIKQQDQIIAEKSKNEKAHKDFLENILPPSLVEELQHHQIHSSTALMTTTIIESISRKHLGVSMLFADLVGFTTFCKQVDAFQVMQFLNDLFQVFDGLCDGFNVYKVETVGDCYVAAVGVVTGEEMTGDVQAEASDCSASTYDNCYSDGDTSTGTFTNSTFHRGSIHSRIMRTSACNAHDLVGFAKAIIKGSRDVMKPVVHEPATLRIGIHTVSTFLLFLLLLFILKPSYSTCYTQGSCITGIIGRKNLKFSLLGDDVTLAAAMEKHGTADCIHASQDLVDLVPDEHWEPCLLLDASFGRAELQTYLLSV